MINKSPFQSQLFQITKGTINYTAISSLDMMHICVPDIYMYYKSREISLKLKSYQNTY